MSGGNSRSHGTAQTERNANGSVRPTDYVFFFPFDSSSNCLNRARAEKNKRGKSHSPEWSPCFDNWFFYLSGVGSGEKEILFCCAAHSPTVSISPTPCPNLRSSAERVTCHSRGHSRSPFRIWTDAPPVAQVVALSHWHSAEMNVSLTVLYVPGASVTVGLWSPTRTEKRIVIEYKERERAVQNKNVR